MSISAANEILCVMQNLEHLIFLIIIGCLVIFPEEQLLQNIFKITGHSKPSKDSKLKVWRKQRIILETLKITRFGDLKITEIIKI